MKILVVVFTTLLTFSFSLAQTSTSQQSNSTRGQRICELYELTLEDGQLSLNIWNNLNFHDCPDEWLEQIDHTEFFVGGPRWRSVDNAITVNEDGTPMDITKDASYVTQEVPAGLGLTMGLAAKVPFRISVEQLEQQLGREITSVDEIPSQAVQRLLGSIETEEYYNVTTVERQQLTIMTHYAGSEVFILNDGECDYAMKYYTNILDASLVNEDAVTQLGDKLSLPDGFSFEVRVFEEDLIVGELDGVAYVLTDEFGNSYDRFSCNE